MDGITFAKHNLVATFPDVTVASSALDDLRSAEVDMAAVSVLGGQSDDDRRQAERDEPGEVTDSMIAGAVKGGAAGGAAGGLIGLLAGAAAVAIPGVGPALATGIWAGVLGGAAGGSTIGGFAGAFRRMWDATYTDALRSGGVVIAIHTDDADTFDRAAEAIHGRAAVVHHYDDQGELLRSA